MIFVLFAMDLTPCYLKLEYKVTHFWKVYELSFSKMFVLFVYNISTCSSNSIFCRLFYEKGGKFEFPDFFQNFGMLSHWSFRPLVLFNNHIAKVADVQDQSIPFQGRFLFLDTEQIDRSNSTIHKRTRLN